MTWRSNVVPVRARTLFDMKKIDAALATSPKLTAEQLSDVKKLRTKPGRLHLLLTDRLVACARELSFVAASGPVAQCLCRHTQDPGCHRDCLATFDQSDRLTFVFKRVLPTRLSIFPPTHFVISNV